MPFGIEGTPDTSFEIYDYDAEDLAMTPHSPVAIVGATGPTGIALSRELVGRGQAVRVIARTEARLAAAFPDDRIERVAADALDGDALRRAIDGCALVVDCIGLPPDRMDHHPRTASRLAEALSATGARGLQVSSYWPFLPIRTLPLTERHPREGGHAYIRLRREAEDILRDAGAAIVHLLDFFGPHVHTSSIQLPLQEAAAGKAMDWIGSADTKRDYAYVPDAMRTVAEIAQRDGAYGGSWLIPGSGPISARRIAEIAGDHLGREVKLRAAPPWMLRLLAVADSDLRTFLPMVPHYAKPMNIDASKLAQLLGALPPTTPHETAIPATLDWIAGHGSSHRPSSGV